MLAMVAPPMKSPTDPHDTAYRQVLNAQVKSPLPRGCMYQEGKDIHYA